MRSQSIPETTVFLGEISQTSLWEGTPLPHPPQHLWHFASHLSVVTVLRGCPAGSLVHPFCWILDPPQCYIQTGRAKNYKS